MDASKGWTPTPDDSALIRRVDDLVRRNPESFREAGQWLDHEYGPGSARRKWLEERQRVDELNVQIHASNQAARKRGLTRLRHWRRERDRLREEVRRQPDPATLAALELASANARLLDCRDGKGNGIWPDTESLIISLAHPDEVEERWPGPPHPRREALCQYFDQSMESPEIGRTRRLQAAWSELLARRDSGLLALWTFAAPERDKLAYRALLMFWLTTCADADTAPIPRITDFQDWPWGEKLAPSDGMVFWRDRWMMRSVMDNDSTTIMALVREALEAIGDVAIGSRGDDGEKPAGGDPNHNGKADVVHTVSQLMARLGWSSGTWSNRTRHWEAKSKRGRPRAGALSDPRLKSLWQYAMSHRGCEPAMTGDQPNSELWTESEIEILREVLQCRGLLNEKGKLVANKPRR